MKKERYSLRTAEEKDAKFLFDVVDEAMEPVSHALRTEEPPSRKDELKRYMEKFEPGKVQIIQFEGKDIGRLRVVRSPESIYVGGIQILPEFQERNIGGAIFEDLIEESSKTGIPIVLEVHHVNQRAVEFYETLGFKEIRQTEKQRVMQYTPDPLTS